MSTSTINTTKDEETFFIPCKTLISKYINVLNDILVNSIQKPTPNIDLPLRFVKAESLENEKASDFLYKLIYKTQLEESTLVYSLIYFERIIIYDIVDSDNSLLFLFICLVISLKINEDLTHKNSFYADLAGISSHYLCNLERLFLELVSFKTFVDDRLFHEFEKRLNMANADDL
jgi:hypothetical protein